MMPKKKEWEKEEAGKDFRPKLYCNDKLFRVSSEDLKSEDNEEDSQEANITANFISQEAESVKKPPPPIRKRMLIIAKAILC